MDKSIKITNSPTQNNMLEIKSWLKEEYKKNVGFYCHLDIIKSAFKNKKLLVLTVNSQAIGFLVYREVSAQFVNIELLEIHQQHRRLGYGKVFTLHVIDLFKGSGVLLIELQCSPVESIKFWRKLKFIEFPNISYWQNTHEAKKMYLPLIPTAKLLKNPKIDQMDSYVELWDKEPYATDDNNPKWVWAIKLNKKKNTLAKPVIYPCCSQWRVRICIDGKIVKDDKYKNIQKNEEELWGFAYIA